MRDKIYVSEFKKTIEIGAFQEERSILQDVLFHVEVGLNPQRTELDVVDDILSYDVIVDAINDTLAAKRYNLLETMADDIAAMILINTQVFNVTVSIEKLGRIDGKLGITIERDRSYVVDQKQTSQSAVSLFIFDAKSQKNPKDSCFSLTGFSSVIIPMLLEFPNDNETDRRIYTLHNDALAWELGHTMNLPVVDTKVEAQSLIARNIKFVRALGKQPFDQIPALDDYSKAGLIKWHQEQLGATSINDLTEVVK